MPKNWIGIFRVTRKFDAIDDHVLMCHSSPLHQLPSNLLYNPHQNQTLKCFSSRLAVAFAPSTKARCWVENRDVGGATPTGDAPSTSEWSTNLLPTKVGTSYIRCFTVPTKRRSPNVDKSRMHYIEFVSAWTFINMHACIVAIKSDFYINTSYQDMYH